MIISSLLLMEILTHRVGILSLTYVVTFICDIA